MRKPIIEYEGEKLYLSISKYVNNDRLYIGLLTEDGELFNDITINLTNIPLRSNYQVCINGDLSNNVKKLLYKTGVFNKLTEQRYNMGIYDIARINKKKLLEFVDTYSIEYLETEEDRNDGFGFMYEETFYDLDSAIENARNEFTKNKYASIEVIKNDGQAMFCKDNQSEDFYYDYNKISKVSEEVLDEYIDAWTKHKELPINNDKIYCVSPYGEYFAVDNSSGECFVEQFLFEKEAQEWLLEKEKVKEEEIENEK